MNAELVVADLTALTPSIRIGERTVHVGNTFCMPWFPGEPALVGAEADRHRRGSSVSGLGEAKFDLSNRARYHWSEPWLGLASEMDSRRQPDCKIGWTPPGEHHVEVRFARVVASLLSSVCDQKNSKLGLVIPAALGQGPQQELLDALQEQHFEQVQLIPRTIAAALCWCDSPSGKRTLEAQEHSGVRIGKIFVTVAAADRWEFVVVPIRSEKAGGGRVLSPVHDRVQEAIELPLSELGRVLAGNLDAHSTSAESMLKTILNATPGPAMGDASFFLEAFASLNSAWVPQDRIQTGHSAQLIRQAVGELVVGAGEFLASVHCGLEEDGVGADLLVDCQPASEGATRLGHESILDGAFMAMNRLERGIPPFHEALAPLDLRVQERNRFQDPVVRWKPLIKAEDVPAGREYRSESPILGLTLPAGQPTIPLVLQTVRSNRTQFFSAAASVRDPKETSEEVSIIARMQPGRGLATVDISSVRPQLFKTHLRIDELEEIDAAPPLEYAWPPGSAFMISTPRRWRSARREIEDYIRGVDDHQIFQDVGRMKQYLDKWPRPDAYESCEIYDRIPNDIDKRFVYLSVVPGSKPKDRDLLPAHLAMLRDLQKALVRNLELLGMRPGRVTGKVQKQQDALRILSSWLYASCPDGIVQWALEELRKEPPVPRSALAIAGRSFSECSDQETFFEELAWCVEHDPKTTAHPNNWLMAYRNIIRMRADALQVSVLPPDRQELLFDWYLRVFESAGNASVGIFRECVRLAPHHLKRRRFVRSFLEEGCEFYERFERLLESAIRRCTGNVRILALCALEFLRKTATEGTLEDLGAADAE